MPEQEVKSILPNGDSQLVMPDIKRLYLSNVLTQALAQAVLTKSPNPYKAELETQLLGNISWGEISDTNNLAEGYPLNRMKAASAEVMVSFGGLWTAQAVVRNNIFNIIQGPVYSNGVEAYQSFQREVRVYPIGTTNYITYFVIPNYALIVPFPIRQITFNNLHASSNIYYLYTGFYYD